MRSSTRQETVPALERQVASRTPSRQAGTGKTGSSQDVVPKQLAEVTASQDSRAASEQQVGSTTRSRQVGKMREDVATSQTSRLAVRSTSQKMKGATDKNKASGGYQHYYLYCRPTMWVMGGSKKGYSCLTTCGAFRSSSTR